MEVKMCGPRDIMTAKMVKFRPHSGSIYGYFRGLTFLVLSTQNDDMQGGTCFIFSHNMQ